MKISAVKQKPKYEPVILSLVLESEEEVKVLSALSGRAKSMRLLEARALKFSEGESGTFQTLMDNVFLALHSATTGSIAAGQALRGMKKA